MRITYQSVPATYRTLGVRRYQGNPFIEALPDMGGSKQGLLDRIAQYPPPPTAADRRKSELDRIAELNSISDLVYPFAVYQRAATHIVTNLAEGYYARNPLTAVEMQRRHAISQNADGILLLPPGWKSSAKGQAILGISGSGKTTLCDAISLPLQIVIEHTEYRGQHLKCRQIPWIKLRIPHDATLKSLCLQFFEVIDAILRNTNYQREAKGARSIAQMTLLIARVSTTVSLGMVFVDELQNLKAARGPQAEFVLNLFSELIEKAGVSLLVAGTPAIESVTDENVRNLRKLTSGAESRFEPMRFGDPEYNAYCDKYWEHQYVKKPRALTPKIREAWYAAGAGNPAFTALSFMLAQRVEIGGREMIDEASFERVANKEMAILQPAIRALRSADPIALRHFDDLIFKRGIQRLRDMIGWSDGSRKSVDPDDEFDEVKARGEERRRGSRRPPAGKVANVDAKKWHELPIENPLLH